MGTNHKIHYGFLFHVNFYHAGLGDTNDDRGFGRDLARIRDILEVLKKANNDGQPVRAAWDFENDYTLGRILPSLGPDVIENVKARLRERGDELLFSGKHAGLFAGMTGRELNFALHYKSNEFGETSSVLRSEGDLFSPSIIGRLRKSGIEAVLLGNSNIGPNALSTVTRDLRKNTYVKYNPATYRHGNNSIIVMPYYTPADFLEEGSLKLFLNSLREKQISGEIEGDIYVLVGADVRSPWWEHMEVRNIFRKSSGTEGLQGFVKALRKLDYIAYNTPTGYLRDHAPVSEISFLGDLAEGCSSDLSAYSELPFDRLIWTRIERARLGSRVYASEKASESLQQRVKLLSASEFGMFSPAPAKDRFAQVDKLSLEIQKIERKAINEKEMSMRTSGRQRLNNSAIGKHLYSRRKDDEERNSFIIMNHKLQKTVSFQLAIDGGQCPKINTLVLECDECKIRDYTAVEMSRENGYINSVFVVMRFEEVQGIYKIYYHFDRTDIPKEPHKPLIELKPEDHPVFHAEGAMKRLLEAQGKLKPAPAKDPNNERNHAVEERIAAMNSEHGITRAKAIVPGTERDSYVITSHDHKLRIVLSGMGVTKGKIREVFYGDERIGDEQFFSSFVKSGGTVSEFTCDEISDAELTGSGEGVMIQGTVHAAGESSPGRYKMQIIKTPALKGIEGILIQMDVTYPSLEGVGTAFLEEIAPLQISPAYRAGVSILRRSFNGVVSDYPVSSFGKAVRENENLASFNHQMTAGIVGAKGALSGLLIGIPRTVLGGFAICPGRLMTDGEGQHLSLNPYGTYGVQHKKYPSDSDGFLQEYADAMVNEKPVNTAAGYSGVREKFCICLAGFSGASPSEGLLAELSAFCDGAVICGDESGVIHPFEGDNVKLPRSYRELPVGTTKREEGYNDRTLKADLVKFLVKRGKK